LKGAAILTADVIGYSRLMAAARTAGALSLALNVRYWHFSEEVSEADDVRSQG
jgi:hypothetical protein